MGEWLSYVSSDQISGNMSMALDRFQSESPETH